MNTAHRMAIDSRLGDLGEFDSHTGDGSQGYAMCKRIARLAHAAVICALGLSPAWAQQRTGDGAAPGAASQAANSAAFALIDHTGRAVTDRDFLGAYMLVFFGYTHCPDICPTDFMVVGEAMDLLGAAGDKVRPVFITIDPARDTVAVMADFVGHFHPRLLGLTGTREQIAAVAKRYRVRWRKFTVVEDEAGGAAPRRRPRTNTYWITRPRSI